MRKILPILLLIPVLTVCFSGFFCADVWTDTEREIGEESGLEDLKKARWYLDHLIAHVEKEDGYKVDTTKYIL